MEILIIIALVLLNGLFSMAEMALVSSRKFKLELEKKKGSDGAQSALDLSENPTKFLSTVQIGITLIGILLGVYSGDNLTDDMMRFLVQFEWIAPYAKTVSVGLIVVFITYLSIVLGELFPKRLGMTFPEPIAIFMAKPMRILSIITSPFVWLLSISNDLLAKIFGVKKSSDSKVSEEEIKAIIKESADGGEIQDIEQDIVERVFELGDRKVNTLLTHRNELVYFNTTDTFEEIRYKINLEKHSAYPLIVDGNLDKIVGIVLLKDLFSPFNQNTFSLEKIAKRPLYLNEDTYAYKVLELFKKAKMHYGIIVDEYGITIGIVTMDDLLDALVGDVSEIDQDEYQIIERTHNSWLVDGQFPFVEFQKRFELDLDFDAENRFNTLAGLIVYTNSMMPNVGDRFVFGNFEMEIVDKDGQRIDKIMITKIR
jgi:putative hemolysin